MVRVTHHYEYIKTHGIVHLKVVNFPLVVQQLGLHTFTAKSPGSVPGHRTKIPQAKINT